MMIIDGLVVSNLERELLLQMQKGGLTAANCTTCVWDDFQSTMKNVADLKKLIRDNSDIAMQIYSVADIDKAKETGKVGIIVGWQNSTGFGDYLPHVNTFAELGLRIVQLTYNTANTAGCGCYESIDRGLTDFGRDLVDALHENRILVDLSHVGSVTARDVIDYASRPVAFSHCCPRALKDHPRNKSDAEIRYIIDKDGFCGVASVPHFLARGTESDVHDFAKAVAHVVNIAGDERIGIGTDIAQGWGPDWFEMIAVDKGYGRRLTSFAEAPVLKGLERLDCYPNMLDALAKAGLNSRVIENVVGRNWYEFLKSTWAQ